MRSTRRSRGQRMVLAIGATVVAVCVTAASGVGYLYWKTGQFSRVDVTIDDLGAPQEPRNYLIIGSDSRTGIDAEDSDAGAFRSGDAPPGQRSDTILLIRVDPGAQDVKMLSFPRDLWVPIADTGRPAKINAA